MSMRETQASLTHALDNLFLHWERTRHTWRDSRARQFETQVLTPLRGQVSQAAGAMERIEASLQRARRECARLSDQ